MPDMTSPGAREAPGELVDTVLAASRALVAVAARSLAAVGDDVTLPQYRALVVLAASGPQGTVELAAALAVNPSTATRMCDRLVRKGLVRRRRQAGDRRAVRIALTPAGRDLVAEVNHSVHRPNCARCTASTAAAGPLTSTCAAAVRPGGSTPRAGRARDRPAGRARAGPGARRCRGWSTA